MAWCEKTELQLLLARDEQAHPFNAVSPSIYQSSTFTFPDYASLEARYSGESNANIYSRTENPTVNELEQKLARLESGEAALAFSSGMAAISSTILALVNAGDKIVSVRNVYSDAYRFFELVLKRFGVEIDYVDCSNLELLASKMSDAKLLYLESPSSFLFETYSLSEIAALAKQVGVTTIIDNSFASPVLQNPLSNGFDLVVHSASKYLSGHSDVVAGCVVGTKALVDKIKEQSLSMLGGKLSAFEAWLLMRGMRTLQLRINEHQQAADYIAQELSKSPAIKKIYRPGMSAPLPKELRGAGGLLTLEFSESVNVQRFCDALGIIRLGVSWGGYESLILPALVAGRSDHGPNAIHDFGVSKQCVRIFVGLEGREKILLDIQSAIHAGQAGGLTWSA